MSYDIYLYKKSSSKQTQQSIWNELKNSVSPDISEVEHQIEYENELTGVYFLADLNEPNDEQEDIELFEKFDGFDYTNISVSINFMRPDYFGMEIFPMLSSIFERLDLYILNLQEFDKTRHVPTKWSGKELTLHWLEHNRLVCEQQFNELNLRFCKKDASDSAWWYSTFKSELEESLGEETYSPNVFFIQDQKSLEVFSYIVWPQHIPIVIPKVDYIIVMKEYKKLFKKIEETGILTYDEVISRFSKFFEPFEFDGNNGMLILSQANSDRIGKDFNSMKLNMSYENFGPQIAKDGFVNHKN